jgi:phosphotransferase system HPr (HPr) family protein
MKEAIIEIKNPTGLHARPAAILVETANKFNSNVKIEKDGKSADAKSILQIMSLGINVASRIKIITEGEDEKELLDKLLELFEKNFQI